MTNDEARVREALEQCRAWNIQFGGNWSQQMVEVVNEALSAPVPANGEAMREALELLLNDVRSVDSKEPNERSIPCQHRASDIRQARRAFAAPVPANGEAGLCGTPTLSYNGGKYYCASCSHVGESLTFLCEHWQALFKFASEAAAMRQDMRQDTTDWYEAAGQWRKRFEEVSALLPARPDVAGGGLRQLVAWLRTSDEARKAPAGEIADKLEAALAADSPALLNMRCPNCGVDVFAHGEVCNDGDDDIPLQEPVAVTEDKCATAPSATNSAAQAAIGTISDTATSDAGTWPTVIVGLPIIRKLLAGQSVDLSSLRVSLIPDDVLWNARPERTESDPAVGKERMLLDWLSEKVEEGKGALVFSMTEEGHVGLFIGDNGPALGIGASALEALENARARAALAGERADTP